jgi:hypothetical protein
MKPKVDPEIWNPNRKCKDGIPINEMNNLIFPYLEEIFF